MFAFTFNVFVQFSRCKFLWMKFGFSPERRVYDTQTKEKFEIRQSGGVKWTRTTDLPLIRRTL